MFRVNGPQQKYVKLKTPFLAHIRYLYLLESLSNYLISKSFCRWHNATGVHFSPCQTVAFRRHVENEQFYATTSLKAISTYFNYVSFFQLTQWPLRRGCSTHSRQCMFSNLHVKGRQVLWCVSSYPGLQRLHCPFAERWLLPEKHQCVMSCYLLLWTSWHKT